MAVPRFEDVPDHWKAPTGPYHQAPPEYGGEWWFVNPFTGPEPWKREMRKRKKEELPRGFEEVFGPRPKPSDFPKRNRFSLWRTALTRWEQDLEFFKQAGVPEWADPEQVEQVTAIFEAWGMGAPKFYEGRFGWMARFPESPIDDHEVSAWGSLNTPHLHVSNFQVRLLQDGIVPEMRHPFVPPQLWPKEEDALKEVG